MSIDRKQTAAVLAGTDSCHEHSPEQELHAQATAVLLYSRWKRMLKLALAKHGDKLCTDLTLISI